MKTYKEYKREIDRLSQRFTACVVGATISIIAMAYNIGYVAEVRNWHPLNIPAAAITAVLFSAFFWKAWDTIAVIRKLESECEQAYPHPPEHEEYS